MSDHRPLSALFSVRITKITNQNVNPRDLKYIRPILNVDDNFATNEALKKETGKTLVKVLHDYEPENEKELADDHSTVTRV